MRIHSSSTVGYHFHHVILTEKVVSIVSGKGHGSRDQI